ncbi:hypothetical protein POP12_126 [Pectobacterium phage POP12]|nr:hypothetical protein POP12_126 [Pectobacterium phage POP12]
MLVTDIHINDVSVGDTVIHLGHLRTVSSCDLSNDDLFGRLLFGDSYRLGRVMIKRVTFPKFYQGKRLI